MADDIVLKVVLDSDLADKSVGDLKKDFKDLQQQLANTKIGTEDYKKTLQSLGVVKGGLQDLKQQIAALNPEKQFASIARLSSTVASGFAAAQGAAALFGTQSEDLQKVLVRVQAATALASGLQGLSGMAKALETARLAMIAFAMSNPFTAIAAGIVALIGVIGGLVTAYQNANSEVAKMESAIEKLNTVYDKQQFLLKEEIRILEARKGFEEETLKKKRELLVIGVKEIELTLALSEAKKKQAIEEENLLTLAEQLVSPEFAAVRRLQRIKEAQEEINDNKKKLEQIKSDLIISFIDEDELKKQKQKKDAKAAKDAAEEAEKNRREESLRSQKWEEDQLKRHQEFLNAAAVIEKDAADKANSERERNEEAEIENEIKMYKLRKDYLQARLNAEVEITQARIELAQGFTGVLSAIAGKQKSIADALFIVDKALAIAGIVVSTQKEIAGYYANPTWSLLPDGGLALKTSAAIAAKIRAATSIATIVATTISKFMNGASASDVGSTPRASAPSFNSPQAPTDIFQPSKTKVNTDENGDFTGFQNMGKMPPIKTYVVETELTAMQKNIKRIENNAKF